MGLLYGQMHTKIVSIECIGADGASILETPTAFTCIHCRLPRLCIKRRRKTQQQGPEERPADDATCANSHRLKLLMNCDAILIVCKLKYLTLTGLTA